MFSCNLYSRVCSARLSAVEWSNVGQRGGKREREREQERDQKERKRAYEKGEWKEGELLKHSYRI